MLQASVFNNELLCSAINNILEAIHNEYDNVCVIGIFNYHLLIVQIIIIFQSEAQVVVEIQCWNLVTRKLMM